MQSLNTSIIVRYCRTFLEVGNIRKIFIGGGESSLVCDWGKGLQKIN